MQSVTYDTVCNQYDQAAMARLVSYALQLNANYTSDDVPLDSASGFNCTPQPLTPYEYLKAWADTMHAAGLHVMFRGNWNHWYGSLGQAKLSYATTPAIPYESSGGVQAVVSGQDTSSYMALTYQFVLDHPDLFQDGDIFEPFGEAMDAGVVNGPAGTSPNCPRGTCQFPSLAAFNQWLSDMTQVEQAAFQRIGKQVTTGWFGLQGISYQYTTASALQYSGTYNMDLFVHDLGSFASQATASYNRLQMPEVAEWGDIWDGGAEPQTANTTDQFLGWEASKPWIVGVEYWQMTGAGSNGPDAAVDYATGQMTAVGAVVAKWFSAMAGTSSPVPAPAATTGPPPPTPVRVPPTPTYPPTPAAPVCRRLQNCPFEANGPA
jgi:hypothetical protein